MIKEDIRKARTALINDTIQYYSKDPKRRSVYRGICLYMHPSGKGGCAIGRLLQVPLRRKLDRICYNTGNGGCNNMEIQELLPKSLTVLGSKFLKDLQNLHDTEQCWNKDIPFGLTEYGERVVKQLHNLPINTL